MCQNRLNALCPATEYGLESNGSVNENINVCNGEKRDGWVRQPIRYECLINTICNYYDKDFSLPQFTKILLDP